MNSFLGNIPARIALKSVKIPFSYSVEQGVHSQLAGPVMPHHEDESGIPVFPPGFVDVIGQD